MNKAYKMALNQARQDVLSAPDRQSAIEAYRYWYALKNGQIELEDNDSDPSPVQPGWLEQLEKFYCEV